MAANSFLSLINDMQCTFKPKIMMSNRTGRNTGSFRVFHAHTKSKNYIYTIFLYRYFLYDFLLFYNLTLFPTLFNLEAQHFRKELLQNLLPPLCNLTPVSSALKEAPNLINPSFAISTITDTSPTPALIATSRGYVRETSPDELVLPGRWYVTLMSTAIFPTKPTVRVMLRCS